MKTILIALLQLSLSVVLMVPSVTAQSQPETKPVLLREVRGQTIFSKTLPAANLTFSSEFRYVGGQRVNLYGNADAEQHIFAKINPQGNVERFYWVQFEQFFPTNNYTYNYPADRSTQFGGLNFVYDSKSWPDYASLQVDDAASDGAALSRLFAQHNLKFPKRAIRIRMFHLPTSDRRTELMIIYGEALPENSKVPVREGGVDLDKELPDAAKVFLDNARRDLTIRKP